MEMENPTDPMRIALEADREKINTEIEKAMPFIGDVEEAVTRVGKSMGKNTNTGNYETVVKILREKTGGDSSKVTEEMITEAFEKALEA